MYWSTHWTWAVSRLVWNWNATISVRVNISCLLFRNNRQQFPVKMTSPITAILYISSDKKHIDELKHTLHVQEVDIAPPQDVNSIAIHKHGHHMAGFAALFWTIFISLIIIFHLFLIKLVYRELCQSGSDTNYTSNYRKSRYARTV